MLIKSKYKKVNLSEKQNNILSNILNKIETKEYSLVDVPCICGKESNDEVITNSFYPNFINTTLNVVVCKNCGTLRNTPYFSSDDLSKFYTNDYRLLFGFSSDKLSDEEKFKDSSGEELFAGGSTYKFLKPFCEEYKKYYNKEQLKIFEIGCGYGGNLYYFHKDGEDVYGCDYGEEGLQVAKNNGMQNMFVGDMNVLKPYGKPDIIIINHVLEHIVDLKLFFNELKEVISKDTLIYIGVPSIQSIGFQYKNNICRYFQIAHVWHFSNNTLDSLMSKEGFEKVESNEIIQSVYKYTGEEKEISLLSEYAKNRVMLQIFDKLSRKKNKEKMYRKSTIGLIGVVVVLLALLVII